MKKNFVKGLIMTIVSFIFATIADQLSTGINWPVVGLTVLGIVFIYCGQNYFMPSRSKFMSLDMYDFAKGLLIALGSAISSFAASIAVTGSIDWQALLITVIGTTSGYLSKNYISHNGQPLKKRIK